MSMRKEIQFERRMYPGYIVFVAVYFDEELERYNYTTLSSLYNLGRMVVVGTASNNFYKCISKTKQFTINFLSQDYLDDILIGSKSGEKVDKLSESNLELESVDLNGKTAQIIKQAQLSYNCILQENFKSAKFTSYNNLICNLEQVIVAENFDVNTYEPFVFIGTDEGRFFRRCKK